jgi:hypothetical protein
MYVTSVPETSTMCGSHSSLRLTVHIAVSQIYPDLMVINMKLRQNI